ncbi:MAG: hypothetical protein QM528_01415 [Phycisphaerales bacterium]|nr:hypothetical protein [Phycisphaerales bacterium]
MFKKVLDTLRRMQCKVSVFLGRSREIHDIQVIQFLDDLKKQSVNPLNRFGAKYFSQNEEDGIILEILRRLGISGGLMVEFGVGDGLENNSIILLASQWKAIWIGNEDLAFDYKKKQNTLSYIQSWITKDNGLQLLKEGLAFFKEPLQFKDITVLSMDIDSYDIYVVEGLFKEPTLKPAVVIVEYNALYPPPIQYKVDYGLNPSKGEWGASLQTYTDLLLSFGYKLVACNITGTNAFYVRQDVTDCFNDVPNNISDIYKEQRYYGVERKAQPAVVESFLKD